MRATLDPLVGQTYLAWSGSKTDRYDAFNRMLAMNPSDEVAALCRQGLAAVTEPERSDVCGKLFLALGESIPVDVEWVDGELVPKDRD